jgi:alpha-ketoglutarate-dependent taurine dioxygenase
MFDWQQGDVLLQDNMSVAHAREPFSGERVVAVGMAEPYSYGAA